MCFHEEMDGIRKAIKAACKSTGFEPILIDEVPTNNTINDAMINEIKSCRFCIADLSKGRNAVYWESGFALGLGKQVILTCQESDQDEIAFDTMAFPRIIYKDVQQLEKLLIDRIKARL
jgi:nucleoside 2-deoxyribosyltransferase